MRGCFVTGTDTDVGKSVLTAAIVAALRSRGVGISVFKPVITGLEDPPGPMWPHDHELLAQMAGCAAEEVVLETFDPAVSPHLAAELAGREPDLQSLVSRIRTAIRANSAPIVEGIGGILVPLGPGANVRDLAGELGLPLVIAARPGLGTINHTLLTLEAARRGELEVAGVVLTPWPSEPSVMELSNRDTIAKLGHVDVRTLGRMSGPDPDELASAGAALPLERWLE